MTGDEDWLPTLLELAAAKDAVPNTIDGISFAPTLLGKPQAPRPFLYREFPGYGGQQSVRLGDWKGIRRGLLAKGSNANLDLHTELYDLSKDPAESHDISAQHPEVLARIERILREQHTPSREFPFPPLD